MNLFLTHAERILAADLQAGLEENQAIREETAETETEDTHDQDLVTIIATWYFWISHHLPIQVTNLSLYLLA